MGLVLVGLVSAGMLGLGMRLLRIAHRTGAWPERWLGIAFAVAGSSAWLIPLAAGDGLAADAARAVAFVAQAGLTGAICFLALFTAAVFRPSSAARALAPLLIVANLGSLAAVVASGMPLPVGATGLLLLASRCAVMLWLFAESAFYARRMRRRLRLGLTDAIVANRFLLWAVWTGALACIPLFVLAMRALGILEAPVPGAPLPGSVRAIIGVLGTGGAAALVACWLAYFPPVAYRDWIAGTPAR
jgi:hypothetical protein